MKQNQTAEEKPNVLKYKFLVIGFMAWGKGNTLKEAKAKCKQNVPRCYGTTKSRNTFKAYLLKHDDTHVTGDGGWEFPSGPEGNERMFEPEALGEI